MLRISLHLSDLPSTQAALESAFKSWPSSLSAIIDSLGIAHNSPLISSLLGRDFRSWNFFPMEGYSNSNLPPLCCLQVIITELSDLPCLQ